MSQIRDGWTSRHLHVSVELLPDFEGWLEFAGRKLDGVAWCPEWPEIFDAEQLETCCAAEVRRDTSCWKISAPSWPEPTTFYAGEWTPSVIAWSPDEAWRSSRNVS